MKNIEPLLKDEVEKIVFPEDLKKNNKNKKNNKPLIITIIIAIFVFLFVGRVIYAFYIGFRYYDIAHPSEVEENKENENYEEISLNSIILNEVYKEIDVKNNNELSSLMGSIYKDKIVSVKDLTNDEKLVIIFSNLGITCNNSGSLSLSSIKEMAKSLFNTDVNMGTDVTKIGNYSISYDENAKVYNVLVDSCSSDENYTVKIINKAFKNEDELYIYENFGYFVKTGENNYDVYGTFNINEEKIMTFIDNYGENIFNAYDSLKTYKWTFKKSDGHYVFSSITPV